MSVSFRPGPVGHVILIAVVAVPRDVSNSNDRMTIDGDVVSVAPAAAWVPEGESPSGVDQERGMLGWSRFGASGGSSRTLARASQSEASASPIHLPPHIAATMDHSPIPLITLLRLVLHGLRARPTQRAATTARRQTADPVVALHVSPGTSPE